MQVDEPMERATGRTTNLVLALVRRALDNPGVKFQALDHWDNTYAHKGVARAAGRVLDTLFVENIVDQTRADGKFYVTVIPRKV